MPCKFAAPCVDPANCQECAATETSTWDNMQLPMDRLLKLEGKGHGPAPEPGAFDGLREAITTAEPKNKDWPTATALLPGQKMTGHGACFGCQICWGNDLLPVLDMSDFEFSVRVDGAFVDDDPIAPLHVEPRKIPLLQACSLENPEVCEACQ